MFIKNVNLFPQQMKVKYQEELSQHFRHVFSAGKWTGRSDGLSAAGFCIPPGEAGPGEHRLCDGSDRGGSSPALKAESLAAVCTGCDMHVIGGN